MIRTLKKMGIEEKSLNVIEVIYDKPAANIILNGELQKLFFSKLRNKTRMSSLPLLFHIVLKVLARTIRQEKLINGIQIGNEKVILSLFAVDMILYTDLF